MDSNNPNIKQILHYPQCCAVSFKQQKGSASCAHALCCSCLREPGLHWRTASSFAKTGVEISSCTINFIWSLWDRRAKQSQKTRTVYNADYDGWCAELIRPWVVFRPELFLCCTSCTAVEVRDTYVSLKRRIRRKFKISNAKMDS